jgi:hypothetical protein
LKLSVVENSTIMRDGRSARAHTIAPSAPTSPDWMPWVIAGRSAALLRDGMKTPAAAVSTPPQPFNRRRRVVNVPVLTMTVSYPRGEEI